MKPLVKAMREPSFLETQNDTPNAESPSSESGWESSWESVFVFPVTSETSSSVTESEPTAKPVAQPTTKSPEPSIVGNCSGVRRWVSAGAIVAIGGYVGYEYLRSIDFDLARMTTSIANAIAQRPSHDDASASNPSNVAPPESIVTSSNLVSVLSPPTKVEESSARRLLEAAFVQASQHDFTSAIELLHQISANTSVYSQAQYKIEQYTQARDMQARVWFYRALELGKTGNFKAARAYLTQIPETTSVFESARKKLEEYQQAIDRQAMFWFQQGFQLAQQGQVQQAIAYWQQIPIGTPAYELARSQLTQYAI